MNAYLGASAPAKAAPDLSLRPSDALDAMLADMFVVHGTRKFLDRSVSQIPQALFGRLTP